MVHQFIEGLYCNTRVIPINIPIVFNRCSLERRAMNQSSRRAFSIERNHAFFVSRIDSLVFRKRVTARGYWASKSFSIRLVIPRVLVIRHVPMKYLSAVCGVIAMCNKVLWQCYNLWIEIAKIRTVFDHTNCVRPRSGKKACSRWRTNGFLAICAKKTSPLFCKLIEIWTMNIFITIAPKFRPQVINRDKKNIWVATSLSRVCFV